MLKIYLKIRFIMMMFFVCYCKKQFLLEAALSDHCRVVWKSCPWRPEAYKPVPRRRHGAPPLLFLGVILCSFSRYLLNSYHVPGTMLRPTLGGRRKQEKSSELLVRGVERHQGTSLWALRVLGAGQRSPGKLGPLRRYME